MNGSFYKFPARNSANSGKEMCGTMSCNHRRRCARLPFGISSRKQKPHISYLCDKCETDGIRKET